MRRAVFLDRDGVINRVLIRDGKPHPPASVGELEILPGVERGLRSLRRAGFVLVGVTNQPDVARGTTRRETVEEINALLLETLALDDILVCYHDDGQGCDCRKPRPGLLIQASRRFGIDLHASFMVGDRWRDIEAGRLAGCRTIFIDYGYAEPAPKQPDLTVTSTSDAMEWIFSVVSIPIP